MSELRLHEEAKPSTPASQVIKVYAGNMPTPAIRAIDDAGRDIALEGVNNFSTASQAPTAATRTYIIGSNIKCNPGDLKIGTLFRWTIDLTKTGAGTATSTFDICFGTLGTTGDTARVSFTKPAGTAVADNGRVVIEAIVRGPIGGSGVVVGHFNLTHNLASTGHAAIPCVDVVTISSGFDVTTPTNVGVCITTGASDVITIQMVIAEAWNL